MKNYTLESYLSYKQEIDAAVSRVLASGRYILGEEVSSFEREFADYIGVSHAVGLGNGTDAIQVALRAGGIRPGDEVITVSNTAVATVAAIELAGATPVLADIDPGRYTMDPDALAGAIGEKTRAVVVVHLFGHPADMDQIQEICTDHGLLLIEDCAQAHGAEINGKKVGTFGDIGAFSFYPTKNIGAFGDAGIMVTNDPDVSDRASAIRQYGWIERNNSRMHGINSRLDELQAAILRVKLPHLERENRERRRLAGIYDRELRNRSVSIPCTAEGCTHAYHQYCIQSDRRDELRKYLADHSVETLVHYPVPIHLQDAYYGTIPISGRLPVTEAACKRILSLPMHPYLVDDDIRQVCSLINGF